MQTERNGMGLIIGVDLSAFLTKMAIFALYTIKKVSR